MLPVLSTPTFKVNVPSLDREILMRPFLVKEEKILLMAKQSGDRDQIFLSLKQVIQNCMVDEDIDVSKLPYYDLEYLFIQLRINSVGESIDVEVTDPDSAKKVKATIDLKDVEVTKSKIKNNIKISDNTALIMKHPSIDEISKVSIDSEVDAFFDTLKYSIKSVFYDDQTYEFVSYSEDEKNEFIDMLSVSSVALCREYISSMPTVTSKAKWTMADGKEKSIEIKGINTFF